MISKPTNQSPPLMARNLQKKEGGSERSGGAGGNQGGSPQNNASDGEAGRAYQYPGVISLKQFTEGDHPYARPTRSRDSAGHRRRLKKKPMLEGVGRESLNLPGKDITRHLNQYSVGERPSIINNDYISKGEDGGRRLPRHQGMAQAAPRPSYGGIQKPISHRGSQRGGYAKSDYGGNPPAQDPRGGAYGRVNNADAANLIVLPGMGQDEMRD